MGGKHFVLGVDIDGICADYIGACAFLIQKELDINIWPMLRVPAETEELNDLLSRYQYTAEMYGWLNPIPYAAGVLRKLQRAVEIVYITARPRSTKAITYKWLSAHGFPDTKIINVRQGKLAAIKRTGANLFIEDRPIYANPLAEAGVNVILLDVYGRDLGYLHEGITVASNWRVVEQLIHREIEVAAQR